MLRYVAALLALSACSSSPPYVYQATVPGGPLPPNSVRLDATVDGCEPDGDGSYRCRLTAHRVIEYGRGGRVTPPETPLTAGFANRDLGTVRAPEVGARIDVLISTDGPPGSTPAYRARRLYAYTSPE